jgi:hypothetical protein
MVTAKTVHVRHKIKSHRLFIDGILFFLNYSVQKKPTAFKWIYVDFTILFRTFRLTPEAFVQSSITLSQLVFLFLTSYGRIYSPESFTVKFQHPTDGIIKVASS